MEEFALTAEERRRFRQMAHGLRVTDPDWFALHGSCQRRYGGPVRCAAAALSLVLIVMGALTGLMLVVFCGIVLASGTLTSHVSSRSRGPGRPRSDGHEVFGAAHKRADTGPDAS